jgi:hypothetical protein
MTSDELTAVCPITSRPELYVATIEYSPGALCLESKSLKLYLSGFRNGGAFCEALAVKFRDDVAKALDLPSDKVRVTLSKGARWNQHHREVVIRTTYANLSGYGLKGAQARREAHPPRPGLAALADRLGRRPASAAPASRP